MCSLVLKVLKKNIPPNCHNTYIGKIGNFFERVLMLYSKVKKIGLFLSLALMLVTFTSCGKQQTILTNVDERDANQILVLLESKGIMAQKMMVKTSGAGTQSADNLWDILVDSSRATEALAILNRIGLPRSPGITMLDIFPGQGMMKTDTEEEIRYNAGLNEQLATTLRKIDGVLDAEVQISFPKEDTFNPEAQKELPKASVFVKHDGILDNPNNLLFQKIRRYISGSIVDLRYEDVTVVTDRARFTDINLRSLEPKSKATPWGNQDFVKIWSIVVSQDSSGSFRTILFLLCFFLLLVILALAWVAWKMQNALKRYKSVKSFFSLKPMEVGEKEEEKVEPDEEPPFESESNPDENL